MKNFINKFNFILSNARGFLCDIDIDCLDHINYFFDSSLDQESKIKSYIDNNTLKDLNDSLEFWNEIIVDYNHNLDVPYDKNKLDLDQNVIYDVVKNLIILVCRVRISLNFYYDKMLNIVGGDE